MSVYLLSTCVEPCIAYFFPVKKPERQTLEIRNIPCLDVFSETDRWDNSWPIGKTGLLESVNRITGTDWTLNKNLPANDVLNILFLSQMVRFKWNLTKRQFRFEINTKTTSRTTLSHHAKVARNIMNNGTYLVLAIARDLGLSLRVAQSVCSRQWRAVLRKELCAIQNLRGDLSSL